MEIKHNRLLLIPLTWLFTVALQAQTGSDVMRQINEIKMNAATEGYLTDQQMTDMPEDSAVVWCASGILRQLGGGYTMADIQPHLHHLVMPRGDKRLVFVYLKKNDLGAPSSTPAQPQTAPKVQARFDIVNGKKVPKKPEANSPNRPHEANGIHEANVPQKPSKTLESHEPQKAPATADRAVRMTGEMMSLPDGKTVVQYLNDMKQKGRIADYGPFGKATDLDHSYIILFTREAPNAPIGILTPVIDGKRTNVQTGQEDDVEAHSGCGAMWFIM